MSPSEFWAMTPTELWWLVEANRPPADYGNMSAAEVAEIYAETYGEYNG